MTTQVDDYYSNLQNTNNKSSSKKKIVVKKKIKLKPKVVPKVIKTQEKTEEKAKIDENIQASETRSGEQEKKLSYTIIRPEEKREKSFSSATEKGKKDTPSPVKFKSGFSNKPTKLSVKKKETYDKKKRNFLHIIKIKNIERGFLMMMKNSQDQIK